MSQRYDLPQLLDIMAQLRSPDGGCPWDLKQSFQTIVPHTLEEAYEVADAIETYQQALVVRAERSSNRNFVELRHRDGTVAWQAMIPTYAGRPGAPGLAASRAGLRLDAGEAARIAELARALRRRG